MKLTMHLIKHRGKLFYSIIVILPMAMTGVLLFYSSHLENIAEAKAYTLINQADQIVAANLYYRQATGEHASSVEQLVKSKYLEEPPAPTHIASLPYILDPTDGSLYLVDMSEKVCSKAAILAATSSVSISVKCISPPTPDFEAMLLIFKDNRG